MTFDANARCELLVGLDDMAILAVEELDGALMVWVESTSRVVGLDVGQSWIQAMPRRCATAAASTRLFTPSFRKMFEM